MAEAARRKGAARRAGEAPAAASAAAAHHDLDRVIHERVRLAIVSALAASPSLTFNELKDLLGTSDGNLSVHARRLEEAGYVACEKGFEGRVPRSAYRLTAAGRRAFGRYVDHLEALIAHGRR